MLQRLLIIAACLLAACGTTQSRHAASSDGAAHGFPEVTGSITLPAGEEAWSLHRLVLEYGKVTGQQILVDDRTRARLAQTSLPLSTAFEIPRDAVSHVVETFLVQADFVLVLRRESSPRIVSVIEADRDFAHADSAPFIDEADLTAWMDHPAYFVKVHMTFQSLTGEEAATVVQQVRGRRHDGYGVAAGLSNDVILIGHPNRVADWARLLRECDHAESSLSSATR